MGSLGFTMQLPLEDKLAAEQGRARGPAGRPPRRARRRGADLRRDHHRRAQRHRARDADRPPHGLRVRHERAARPAELRRPRRQPLAPQRRSVRRPRHAGQRGDGRGARRRGGGLHHAAPTSAPRELLRAHREGLERPRRRAPRARDARRRGAEDRRSPTPSAPRWRRRRWPATAVSSPRDHVARRSGGRSEASGPWMPSVAAATGERRAAPGEARRGRQTERDGLELRPAIRLGSAC